MTQDAEYVALELRPVTLEEARRFVAEHHRHNDPPVTWKFGVGVESEGQLVGVAMAGLPKARALMDGHTLEVNRTCTLGARNANSLLYGAIARAAKALGYHRLVTYTLAEEPGSSLRGAGWQKDGDVPARETWDTPSRPRQEVNLFGERTRPTGPKTRWVKLLIDGPGAGGSMEP